MLTRGFCLSVGVLMLLVNSMKFLLGFRCGDTGRRFYFTFKVEVLAMLS